MLGEGTFESARSIPHQGAAIFCAGGHSEEDPARTGEKCEGQVIGGNVWMHRVQLDEYIHVKANRSVTILIATHAVDSSLLALEVSHGRRAVLLSDHMAPHAPLRQPDVCDSADHTFPAVRRSKAPNDFLVNRPSATTPPNGRNDRKRRLTCLPAKRSLHYDR